MKNASRLVFSVILFLLSGCLPALTPGHSPQAGRGEYGEGRQTSWRNIP